MAHQGINIEFGLVLLAIINMIMRSRNGKLMEEPGLLSLCQVELQKNTTKNTIINKHFKYT